jgi:hypothetical protein
MYFYIVASATVPADSAVWAEIPFMGEIAFKFLV